MEIHIIVHSRSHPIRAFLNKEKAMDFYNDLKQQEELIWGDKLGYVEIGSYGVISLKIDDGDEEEVKDVHMDKR